MSTDATSSASPQAPADGHRYSPALAGQIETRWQVWWDEQGTYHIPNPSDPIFDASRPKFYCLDMFPYPSGAGLHVGHPEGYTATDIVCRFKRMSGYNVLHPMGWDAFGLPAEQYAIQTGVHPAITTRRAIDNFRRQLKRFGFCYDWSREFGTIDPDYYRWTQWIFLQIYNAWFDAEQQRARPISELVDEFAAGKRRVRLNPAATEYTGAGDLPGGTRMAPWNELDADVQRMIIDSYRLAYAARQTVNWCPKLGTALANEEVIDGRSERGGFPVFRKPMRQWMFRITAYADRLLDALADVSWPESTKTQQAEWIGRSEGAEADFPILDQEGHPSGQALRVFTTRPDTIFGATYMVVAPEHPLVDEAIESPTPETDEARLRAYVESARNRSDVERMESKEKTGVFTGRFVKNPATGEPIPVWTSDYVLMGYGTGAIMAVPAHDDRDWAFAKQFDLPIVQVVEPANGQAPDDKPFCDEGVAINSANEAVSLNGLPTREAKRLTIKWLECKQIGTRRINYRLRDWLFSRQRYWGEPFPIVWDARGNHHAVSEDHLPVTLPDMADYAPVESDDPQPLLGKATEWLSTTAGQVGVRELDPATPVTRETNTMPGWAGSCWYYLRYCDPHNAERFVGEEAERYWMGSQQARGHEGTGVRSNGATKGTSSPRDESEPRSGSATQGGVDLYIGGSEHAVLHLLYARFWHKVLFDLGHVSTDEPFGKLFHQGLITSFAFQRSDKTLVPADEVWELQYNDESGGFAKAKPALGDAMSCGIDAPDLPKEIYETLTKTGSAFVRFGSNADVIAGHLRDVELLTQITAKMSKSLKNVVNPDDVIAEYGADTFRLYEMYMGPLEASKPWNTRDIIGLFRFLQRAWRLCIDENTGHVHTSAQADAGTEKLLHRTTHRVGRDIEKLSFNTAIAGMIEFVNAASTLTSDQMDRFVRVLSPFAPHMAEELWHRLGRQGASGSVALQSWPTYDEAMLVDSEIEIPVQVLGKLRSKITVPADAGEDAVRRAALADPRIAELIAGKTVRKVIIVPGRLVNIVAN
ncbi:MAG: leucine--tRNA ligase [Leptolyngbya sp. PLA3]|nr:MAG: leucine--tRNA ligase [Cyanobacteria bacterium CYA]MCE7967383.1 leucine--tRNA ligase [Leptolyngbya sp. PL-A3]